MKREALKGQAKKDFDEYYKLWAMIAKTREIVNTARDIRNKGIPPSQGRALYYIYTLGDEVTPAMLSRSLLRKPHGVSQLLDRMEKKGLINKTKDLDKKNLVRVTLTKEGIKAFQQVMQLDMISRIMSSLTKNQRDQLNKLLDKIQKAALKELGVEV